MRTQSDKKLKTEKVLTSRDMFSSLATAETVRTASHVMIAGNALFSAHLSPLLSSSLNSIFSTLATSITYGRTPQKIQQARLEDLKMLIENSRPLFAPEMQIFFAKSASYQTLKKQFENLNQKYSARIESESKTFRYLILAIGLIGSLYFAARLLQDSDELNWVEIISVLGMIGMMSYSNVQSHQELVMRSKKDYQEFIEALIQFNTHVIEEVPILKIVTTLEKTKKEMESCEEELEELGVEMPEIREADEGGVEESKGEEKSLMQRVEERLQSLVGEKNKEAKEIQQKMISDLEYIVSEEDKNSIKQQAEKDIQRVHSRYEHSSILIQSCLKKLWFIQKKYRTAYEELRTKCEKFSLFRSLEIGDDEMHTLEEKIFNGEFFSVKEINILTVTRGFGVGI